MEDMQQCLINIKYYASLCGATVVTFICSLVGTETPAFQFLLCLMVADYATGLVVAGVFHKSRKTKTGSLSSAVGFRGLLHKTIILLNIFIAVRLETVINVNYTGEMVVGWYIVLEAISILENGGLMGVKYPKKLKRALEALNDKEE